MNDDLIRQLYNSRACEQTTVPGSAQTAMKPLVKRQFEG